MPAGVLARPGTAMHALSLSTWDIGCMHILSALAPRTSRRSFACLLLVPTAGWLLLAPLSVVQAQPVFRCTFCCLGTVDTLCSAALPWLHLLAWETGQLPLQGCACVQDGLGHVFCRCSVQLRRMLLLSVG